MVDDMTSRAFTFGTLVAAAVLGAGATPEVTGGEQAEARIDSNATKVVGGCKPGTGKIEMTVLPTAENTYQVTVKASRLLEDSRWRAEFVALSADPEEEVGQTFRPRAVEGSWSFTTEVTFEEGGRRAQFSVDARTSGDDIGDIICLLDASPARPVAAGSSLCAKGFNALLLRQRGDETLVVKHLVWYGAPNTRWRMEFRAHSAEEGQAVTFDDVSNKNGVVSSRVELSPVPEDSVFTIRAESERGTRCRLRINPGPLTAQFASDA